MFDDLDSGWGNYAGNDMGCATMGAIGGLLYTPNLSSVGSGSSYFPGSTTEDAKALAYVGFYPEVASHVISTGSQQGDMANEAGAWDPDFRTAVGRFQSAFGLTVDGWIGPNTRRKLAEVVAAKSAADPLPAPPVPVPTPIVPPSPSPTPTPTPGPVAKKDNTMLYAGLGVGGVALLGLGYWALK